MNTQFHTGPEPRSSWTLRLVIAGLAVLGLLSVALLVGVVVLLLNSRSAETTARPTSELAVGAPAPDFVLSTLEGDVVRLSELRGRGVWLNFWASWCTPCRAEMPELIQVGEEARENGVVLVAVATGEPEQTARDYLERSGYTALPATLDADGRVATHYKVRNLPTHVFIDAEGIVRDVRIGSMEGDEMRAAVRTLQP